MKNLLTNQIDMRRHSFWHARLAGYMADRKTVLEPSLQRQPKFREPCLIFVYVYLAWSSGLRKACSQLVSMEMAPPSKEPWEKSLWAFWPWQIASWSLKFLALSCKGNSILNTMPKNIFGHPVVELGPFKERRHPRGEKKQIFFCSVFASPQHQRKRCIDRANWQRSCNLEGLLPPMDLRHWRNTR